MKVKFYKYFGIILAFLAISCEADRAMPEQNNTFTLEQAKHFHMEHATDLRLPGTGDGSVKSAIDYNEILVPQWDKAIYHEVQFPSKLARTYEVPLNTGSIVGGVLLKENATEHDVVTMKSSLIIQEFLQGENTSNRQMVVTVLGKDSDNNAQSDAFSYMGSHKDFTGFMVVSTLEGEIVNIFQYLCGQRSVVYVRRTDDAPINAPLSGFSFLKVQGTKSSYGNSEPGFCHMCGKEGMVYIEYGHICESCLEGSELLDGIVVTDKPSYCDKCGELKGKCVCNPFACPICGYEPCQCDDPDGRCEYCGEIGCNGECREDEGKPGGGNQTGGSTPGFVQSNNPTLSTVVSKVLNSNNAKMKQIVSTINSTGISITFNKTDMDGWAWSTFTLNDAFKGNEYTVNIGNTFLELSAEAQTLVVIHEFLHIHIYALLYGQDTTTINTVVPGITHWLDGKLSNMNEASHEIFARDNLDLIKSLLEELAPGLDAEKAKWGSLTETEEFDKLSDEDKKDINGYLEEQQLNY